MKQIFFLCQDLQQLTELDAELGPCLAVFMLATDNTVEFNKKLTNDGMELGGMKFAVLGLGNKTYNHLNKMGKFVDAKLEELGAQRVQELGLGDDDANLEDDFITWKEAFWAASSTAVARSSTCGSTSTRS